MCSKGAVFIGKDKKTQPQPKKIFVPSMLMVRLPLLSSIKRRIAVPFISQGQGDAFPQHHFGLDVRGYFLEGGALASQHLQHLSQREHAVEGRLEGRENEAAFQVPDELHFLALGLFHHRAVGGFGIDYLAPVLAAISSKTEEAATGTAMVAPR